MNEQNDSQNQGTGLKQLGQGAKAASNILKAGKKAVKIGKKVLGVKLKKYLLIGGAIIMGFLVVLAPLVAFYNSVVAFFMPVIKMFDKDGYANAFYDASEGSEDMREGYVELGDALADDFADFWSGKRNNGCSSATGTYNEIRYDSMPGDEVDTVKGIMQIFCVKEMYGMCHPDIVWYDRPVKEWAKKNFKEKYGESLLDFECDEKKDRLSKLFDQFITASKKKRTETVKDGAPDSEGKFKEKKITFTTWHISIKSVEQYINEYGWDSDEEAEFYKQFEDSAVKQMENYDEMYLRGVYYGYKSTDNYAELADGGGVYGYFQASVTGVGTINQSGYNMIVNGMMPSIIENYESRVKKGKPTILPSVCIAVKLTESGWSNSANLGQMKNGKRVGYSGLDAAISAFYSNMDTEPVSAQKAYYEKARKEKNPYLQAFRISRGHYCVQLDASQTDAVPGMPGMRYCDLKWQGGSIEDQDTNPVNLAIMNKYYETYAQYIYSYGLERFDKCVGDNAISAEEAARLPIESNRTLPPSESEVNGVSTAGGFDNFVQGVDAQREQLVAFTATTVGKKYTKLTNDGTNDPMRYDAGEWCTDYVTYCIRHGHAYSKLSKAERRTAAANGLYEAFKKADANGTYKFVSLGDKNAQERYRFYTPRAGDILFLHGSPYSATVCHHTAIIMSYDPATKTITYANGNCRSEGQSGYLCICEDKILYSSSEIMGIGTVRTGKEAAKVEDVGTGNDKKGEKSSTGNLVEDFNNSYGKKDTGSGDTLIPETKKKN